MPQLTRGTSKLLRTVGGKRHATNIDHEEDSGRPRKSPKLDETEDLTREPDDSSEEDDLSQVASSSPKFQIENAAVSNRTGIDAASPRNVTLQPNSRKSKSRPTGHGKSKVKPNAETPVVLTGSDDPDDSKMAQWDIAPARRKKQKTFSNNFHLPPAAPTASKSKKAGFNKPPQPTEQPGSSDRLSKFKTPLGHTSKASSNTKTPQVATFKMPLAVPEPSSVALNPQRRSSRLTSATGPSGTMQGSNFKMGRGLDPLNGSSGSVEATRFSVRGLTGEQSDLIHSQDDVEQADLNGEYDLEEEQMLLADEDEVTTCPYCNAAIPDAELAGKLRRGKQMNVRQQASFCQSHRQAEARLQWAERGYPEIEWDKLPLRVSGLWKHVLEVVENKTSSIFRDHLAKKISDGRHRSMLQTLNHDASSIDSLTPGYYGGKGAKILSTLLINEFAESIRDHAGQDRLIGAAGVGGFVQAVLVPEVAAQLVMEDMEVDEARAVKVLEESAEMGDLLFEGDDEEGIIATTST